MITTTAISGSYDRYTSSFDGPVAHDEVAEWAEEFFYQTDNERMLITIVETSQQVDEGCFNDIETVRTASYLALIHGAQGLLFFDDPGPNADLSVYDSCGSCCGPQWWEDLSDLLTEYNDLAYTALHNSVAETIGYVWGDSHGSDLYPLEHTVWGDGTTDNTQIHAIFRRNYQTQDRYLISINAYTQETTATFSVSGINAGDEVQVVFENRSIMADDGTFSDSFATGQRHVYYFSGGTSDSQ